MRVTIKDIARLANVSHSTVSRALNHNPAIPDETRERIQAIANEIGYLPSAAARGLRTNHAHAIGVVVSQIDDPYFGEILQGIEDVLQPVGYSLFVASSHYDLMSERAIAKALGAHRVDGVLVCSVPFLPENAYLLERFGLPVVFINNQSDEDYQYSIMHDDLNGSRQVVSHLLDLGHRRLAYLGSQRSGRTNRDRLRGFHLALDEAGIPMEDRVVLIQPASELVDGAEGADQLLKSSLCPTALFCYNDLMAAGALRNLNQAGISVPQDLSLAGFDNIPFSAYTQPPLTTFDQPKRLIGCEAAEMMLELLACGGNENKAHSTRVLQGRLLVRESTGPVNLNR